MILYRVATTLTRTQKMAILLLLDVAMVPLALALAIMLNGKLLMTSDLLQQILPLTLILMLLGGLVSSALGLPRVKLNAYESKGIARTAVFAVLIGVAGLFLNTWTGRYLPAESFFVFTMIYVIVAVTLRMVLRQFLLWIYRRGVDRLRVVIYGAGQTGQQLAAALRTDGEVEVVAFVDDNPTLHSMLVLGMPVQRPADLREMVAREKVDRIVLAMPSTAPQVQARIAQRLRPLGIEVHSLPSFSALIGMGEVGLKQAAMPLDELLGRENLDSELPDAADAYAGRTVLITGAGGSIGSELCRQLLRCHPARLILLDHSELALYNVDKELRDLSHGAEILPVLGSVTDARLVRHLLNTHHIEVVLHAAAYKHLPLVEDNEIAGLNNNVIGTKIVADAARAAGVPRFILISSDKAVRPTNVMGASKRLAEMVVQDLATRSRGTKFAMVRFGNVLGSSGSVIPLFREQIARGGPVTLTHGEVTRYFMTISEAARLVLLAGSYARGGDLFVLDMGKPVQIRTLARQMIEGAGLTVRDHSNPHGDIEILITGLRPGEKLHEELLISPDMLTTPHPKILRAQEGCLSELEMANALRDLRESIEGHDVNAARSVIARWVESSTPAKLADVTQRP